MSPLDKEQHEGTTSSATPLEKYVDDNGNDNEKRHQHAPAGALIQIFDMLEYSLYGVIHDTQNRQSYFEVINYWIEQYGGSIREKPYGRLYIRCQLAKIFCRGIFDNCNYDGDNDSDGKNDDDTTCPLSTYDSKQWEECINEFKTIKSLLICKDATSFIYVQNNTPPPPPPPSDDADDVTTDATMTILDENRLKLPIITDRYKIMKREFVLQQALSYLRMCCGETNGDDAERPKDENAPFPWKDAMNYSDLINKYFKDDDILPALRSIIVKPPNVDSDPLDERSWCIASTTKLKELLKTPEFSLRHFRKKLMNLLMEWDLVLPKPHLVRCGYVGAKDDNRRRCEVEMDDVMNEEDQQRLLEKRNEKERKNRERVDERQSSVDSDESRTNNDKSPTERQHSSMNTKRVTRKTSKSEQQRARLHEANKKLSSQVEDPLPEAVKHAERVKVVSKRHKKALTSDEEELLEMIEKQQQVDGEQLSSQQNDDNAKNIDKDDNSDDGTQTQPPSPRKLRLRRKRDRARISARQMDFADTEDDSSDKEKLSLSSLPERRKIRVAESNHNASSIGSVASTYSNNRRKRGRKFWTREEKQALVKGLKKYGPGNWKEIKEFSKETLKDRNPIQIKDCYRTMINRGELLNWDNELV